MGQEFNSAFFLANGPWFKQEGKCCNYKHQRKVLHERTSKDKCKQICMDDKKCRAYENIYERPKGHIGSIKWDCNIFFSDEEFDHSVSCDKSDPNTKKYQDECHTKGKVCHCQYR